MLTGKPLRVRHASNSQSPKGELCSFWDTCQELAGPCCLSGGPSVPSVSFCSAVPEGTLHSPPQQHCSSPPISNNRNEGLTLRQIPVYCRKSHSVSLWALYCTRRGKTGTHAQPASVLDILHLDLQKKSVFTSVASLLLHSSFR